MKNRLNITIDDRLIEEAKHYAAKNNKSLSQLVEENLRKLVSKRKPKRQTFLEYMDSLPKPKRQANLPEDIRSAYYESRRKKYGF